MVLLSKYGYNFNSYRLFMGDNTCIDFAFIFVTHIPVMWLYILALNKFNFRNANEHHLVSYLTFHIRLPSVNGG